VRTDLREPDNPNENPYQSAYWSYVSGVLARSFPRPLPAWYLRGVSEVWSNTRVRDKEIHVGRVIQSNVQRVRQGGLIRLDEFLSAEGQSRWLTQESEIVLFDAQAWAFVHFLMFGDSGAHSAKLNVFSRLLMDGKTQDVALNEAFGDVKPYFDKIHLYSSQSVMPFARVAVSLDLDVETLGSRTLTVAEAALARAEFLVAKGRPVEARALAAEAAQADPQSPGPWEVEAQILDRENQDDKAREAFAKAAELGSRRAFVYYRLAQLEWKPGWDEARVKRQEAMLRRAHELDPADTNVMSSLADTLAALRRPEEALPLARQAVQNDPSSSYHRLTLARIARDLGRVDDAIPIAESAVSAADDDAERRRAQEFLDSLQSARSQAVAPRAPVEAENVPTATGESASVGSALERLCGQQIDAACLRWARQLAAQPGGGGLVKARAVLEATCSRKNEEACSMLATLPR
jgi:tetratricopeptide (TPR) repeat protein